MATGMGMCEESRLNERICSLSDVIDIVKDQLYGADYVKEEDPTLFISQKTNRGPLYDGWIADYWDEVRDKMQPTSKNMALMCAYKLCRVEFRYWGMQTKLEKFIHDTALRKTMVRAHRQAWAWQDEWHGLTMDDIREIERQTQVALQKKMGDGTDDAEEDGNNHKQFRIWNARHCHLIDSFRMQRVSPKQTNSIRRNSNRSKRPKRRQCFRRDCPSRRNSKSIRLAWTVRMVTTTSKI